MPAHLATLANDGADSPVRHSHHRLALRPILKHLRVHYKPCCTCSATINFSKAVAPKR